MSEIKIPEGELSEVIGKAILDHLSETSRQDLIKEALKYLLTAPITGRYGEKSPSPLQVAFNDAVRRIAYEAVEQLVRESDKYQLVKDGVAKMLDAMPNVEADYEMQQTVVNALVEYARKKLNDAENYR